MAHLSAPVHASHLCCGASTLGVLISSQVSCPQTTMTQDPGHTGNPRLAIACLHNPGTHRRETDADCDAAAAAGRHVERHGPLRPGGVLRLTDTDALALPRRDGLSGSSATLLLLLLCSSVPLLVRAALLSRLPAESFLPAAPILELVLLTAAWLSSPLSEAVSGAAEDASSPSACRHILRISAFLTARRAMRTAPRQ